MLVLKQLQRKKILLCDNLSCYIPVIMMKLCTEQGLLPVSWPPDSMCVTDTSSTQTTEDRKV